MAKARVPTDDQLQRITGRGVAEIIPERELLDGLRAGKPLRLKLGLDPTRPVVTLGWAVPLRKLRQLQDLGHTAVIIVGDWTARIGDPSGQSQTRSMLTAEEVNANCEAVLPQFFKILDESRTEVRRQSEWFDGFDLTEVVRLTSRFTVAQIMERDDFAQRYAERKPVGLHELLYPLLQGYDSVAIEADVEFGGTDQKFNILVGRELQRAAGQTAGPTGEGQAVFLVPLLVGLDGAQKMSQSLGNFVAINDPPHDMYGKLMSIPDTLIGDYFELLTDVPESELAEVREAVARGGAEVRDAKMRLAGEIVSQFHSLEAAVEAERGFVRTFREKEAPEEGMLTVGIPFERAATALREGSWIRISLWKSSESPSIGHGFVSFEGGVMRLSVDKTPKVPEPAKDEIARQRTGLQSGSGIVLSLLDIIEPSLRRSRLEAKRLIRQKGVDVDGQTVGGEFVFVSPGSVIRVGKHRFLRIVDADL
ncbi:MAG: tyrosine--tRNA ligase [Dehalococcoidia bacterium]